MKRMMIGLLGTGLLLCASAAWAEDWPQWRGPNRDGIMQQSPPLAEAWPKSGPPKVWQSELLPGSKIAGFSSPVVAGGKVYAFASGDPSAPLRERTFGEGILRQLGWFPQKPPPGLLAKIEEARVSGELAKSGAQRGKWIDTWLEKSLTEDERKAFEEFARDRMRRNKEAHDLAALDKLGGIKDRTFETQEVFDKWLADNSITGKLREEVVNRVPKTEQRLVDIVLCVNAADGKTVWKKEFPHVHGAKYKFGGGASATPCVAGGRVYVLGTACVLYCLDAATGKEIWKGEVGNNTKKRDLYIDSSASCSPIVIDGLVIVQGGPLTAFEAATGKVKWTQQKVPAWHSSPMAWEKDRKKYVLCCTHKMLLCVAAETGALVWDAPGGTGRDANHGSPVIQGDILITGSHPTAFRLSPEKAEKIWEVEGSYRGSSALIHEGLVYMACFRSGEGHLACIDIKTGKELWWELDFVETTSPIAVDGKILATMPNGDRHGLGLFKPTPTGVTLLAKFNFNNQYLNCTTPAFFDGKIVVRTQNALACYDLTAKAMQ
jgi:outer membrane protein assembly factor BamB